MRRPTAGLADRGSARIAAGSCWAGRSSWLAGYALAAPGFKHRRSTACHLIVRGGHAIRCARDRIARHLEELSIHGV